MVELEIAQLTQCYRHLRVLTRRGQDRLVASLSRYGQNEAVLVVSPHEESYVLIDGYKRVSALTQLGRDTVKANLLAMTEVDALIMTQALARGPKRSALEDAWLLRELIDQHGLSQRRLAERLQRSPSWVSRRLALVDTLPECAQKAVRDGRLSACAAGKYLVPLSRDNIEDCETLVQALGTQPVSSRDLERIYTAYRRAPDREQQKRIVEHPHMLLKTLSELERNDPELTEVVDKVLVQDLNKIVAISQRVEHDLLRKYALQNKLTEQPSIRRAWTRVDDAISALESWFAQ